MTRCDTDPGPAPAQRPDDTARQVLLESRVIDGGLRQTVLSVPAIHCGGCVQRIETALSALPSVASARVNLTSKLATIAWRGETPPALVDTLRGIGFDSHLRSTDAGEEKDTVLPELLRALAVAGFAATNIMMLSVGVWSGADTGSRSLFYWLSALIAVPTVAYAGQVFFRSAWQALRHGQTNMDVPISIGVIVALCMGVYETATGGAHAFFDASVSLLFFLLIGRTLDHVMRERARQAVRGLARLAAPGAMVQQPNGTLTYLPTKDVRPGMTILLAAGERVPVDARVRVGTSDLDCSLVSGETAPQAAAPGTVLLAGTLNLNAPLTIEATAAATDSFLAEMMRMMEAAEAGRTAYRRIADRAARLYAPAVHGLALLALIGWIVATGDVHYALTVAVAVLIITCPCALGLAVPMVQVVAAKRLFETGIMVKDGAAMERLAEVDTVVFDKTGTLTLGAPTLVDRKAHEPATLALVGAMAVHSSHPFSRALAAAAAGVPPVARFDDLQEHVGLGIEARAGATVYRLGRPTWAVTQPAECADHAGVALSQDCRLVDTFRFEETIRPGAATAVDGLRAAGFGVEIVSGDHEIPVRRLAARLGISYEAGVVPAEKTAHVAALAAAGHKVLMVGDGLNDAPALMAAHASMAPASAADVGRNSADFVFLRDSLQAVTEAIAVARRAQVLVRQNLALALAYNAIAVPIAILGYVTPLAAAIAMSASSLVVVANALRLKGNIVAGSGRGATTTGAVAQAAVS